MVLKSFAQESHSKFSIKTQKDEDHQSVGSEVLLAMTMISTILLRCDAI